MHVQSSCFAHKTNCFLTLLSSSSSSSLLKVPTMMKMRLQCAFIYFVPGGTPYNGQYKKAPPERGNFFRHQVYERAGILLVEVYERIGRSVISVCKT